MKLLNFLRFPLFTFIIFGAGTFVGYMYKSGGIPEMISNLKTTEVRLPGYKFISPLLECEYKPAYGITEYNKLEKSVRDYIENEKEKGDVTDVSMYYRDLNNGPWIGIHERTSFSPASLLKLPVLMAYMKRTETDPTILQKEIEYKNIEKIAAPRFAPTKALEVGKKYVVEDLLERMIVYSDNEALRLLEENIPEDFINKVTLDLGVETPNVKTPEDFMTVKSYASLFRVLYNASYLSAPLSEKALAILSKVDFKEGMYRGIPQSVEIAHKFGERELDNGIKQLHDCGIVYAKNPFLLCIMTRGRDYATLSNVIGTIAKQVYTEISSRSK